MKKTYYVNEYSPKRWVALINQAIAFGCQMTYNIYGNKCEIDSTETEDRVLAASAVEGAIDESKRQIWANHIHNMLQEASVIVRYKVQPKRPLEAHNGQTHIFKSRLHAVEKAKSLEYYTHDEYEVVELDPDKEA